MTKAPPLTSERPYFAQVWYPDPEHHPGTVHQRRFELAGDASEWIHHHLVNGAVLCEHAHYTMGEWESLIVPHRPDEQPRQQTYQPPIDAPTRDWATAAAGERDEPEYSDEPF